MATLAHATKPVLRAGEDLADRFHDRLSSLRHEIAAIADQVSDLRHDNRFEHARDTFEDIARTLNRRGRGVARSVGHDARSVFEDVSRTLNKQGKVLAREVGHDARVATDVLRANPVPVLVALGTVVLVASLLRRH